MTYYQSHLKLINSEEDIIRLLQEKTQEFDLSDCIFNLEVDLLDIVKRHPIEGISVIEMDEYDLEAYRVNVSSGLSISNLRFSKPVKLGCSIFNGPLKFSHLIFEKQFSLAQSVFNGAVTWDKIEVNDQLFISYIEARKDFLIGNSIIEFADSGFKQSIFRENFTLINNRFTNGVNLSYCQLDGIFNIISGSVGKYLDLSHSKINRLSFSSQRDFEQKNQIANFSFVNAVFNEAVIMNEVKIKGEFNGRGALFEKAILICNTYFDQRIDFSLNVFNDVFYMKDCFLNGDLDFCDAIFNSNFSIERTPLHKAAIRFKKAKINHNLSIGNHHSDGNITKLTHTIDFQEAFINEECIVRLYGLNTKNEAKGRIRFNRAVIKGTIDITDVYLSEICFTGAIITGTIHNQYKQICRTAITDEDTARILKNAAKKDSNSIAAKHYYSIEIALHSKTITLKDFNKRVMLTLNHWSNNYGNSWPQGIAFTFIVGLLFFTLVNLTINLSANFLQHRLFWISFIRYIWLPSSLNDFKIEANSIFQTLLGMIIFITGKILIAYGVFQTITAFRKYLID